MTERTIDATAWALHGLDSIEWLLSQKSYCSVAWPLLFFFFFFIRQTPSRDDQLRLKVCSSYKLRDKGATSSEHWPAFMGTASTGSKTFRNAQIALLSQYIRSY